MLALTNGVLSSEQSFAAQNRVLIAFFSRADENYAVGTITIGNTRKVAEVLAGQTGGTLFEIKPKKAYPARYRECTDLAKKELEANVRPDIEPFSLAIADFDEVYLGYPIWWSDMPMPVYTFLDQVPFKGKIVHPFCTHEGSGLSGTEKKIATYTGATVTKGFELRGKTAQTDPGATEKAVQKWLASLS